MKSGFYVSSKQAIIILILFVIIVVFVGLMAGLIKESCPEVNGDMTTTPATTLPSATSTAPPEAGPWLDPFLPAATMPVHYDLWLYPDFYWDGSTFTGRVDIEINIVEATRYLIVHYKFMTFSNTKVTMKNGDNVGITREFSHAPNQFRVVEVERTLSVGSTVILHLEFAGSLVNGIVGFYKSNYTNTITGQQSWLATSKFQPTDARKAFPCFDEPKYKTTFQVTLRHWSNFTALSNTPVLHAHEVAPGWNETTFQKTVVMSSYLVCFIVTDFIYTQRTMHSGKPHRVWTSQDKINQTLYAADIGTTMADWFATELNMSFHLPKLDQVAVPDYPSGATEHWGLITYRETNLLFDEKTVAPSGRERVAMVVGHELAHNYFGNLITCLWWDDLWLNEAFAQLYEYRSQVTVNPDWLPDGYFVVGVMHPVMEIDATTSSRPIIIEVTHPDDINQAFDGITYDKGASMLRMIESFTGPVRFRQALRQYLVDHAYGTVTSQDLWNSIQQELGGELDVTEVMGTWTQQMGLPVIDITLASGEFTATPKRFLSNPKADPNEPESPHEYKWYIPFSYRTPSANKTLWMNKTSVTFNDPRLSGEWIKFNPGNTGYYRVNYPKTLWEDIASRLQDNYNTFGATDRSNLLDDALNLARASQLDYNTALTLTLYLEQETHYFPWRSSRAALEYISNMLYGHQDYHMWRKYVRQQTEKVMSQLKVEDSGEHLDEMLRIDIIKLACGHGNSDCLRNVTKLFQAWIADPVAGAIGPGIRQEVYMIGMSANGGEEEFNTIWERYLATNTAQEKLYLLNALAQSPHIYLIQRYLEYCRDPIKVKSQDFVNAVQYAANNPVGTLHVWEWVQEHYAEFVERFGTSDRYFGRMVPNIVSRFKTEFQLQQVKDFYARFPDAGAGATPRAQSLDGIQNNIEWRANNEELVIQWLKDNVSP